MDRRTRNLLALAMTLVIAATGGAAILFSVGGAPGLGDLSDRQSVVGVIVGVESEGIDKVRGFTLRTTEGGSIRFVIRTVDGGFPPGHLVEHQSTAQAVRVSYVMEGDTRVAVRLEDAP